MNQILRAFGQVACLFNFCIFLTTIIELISIYSRLQAFEAAINDQPLTGIDKEFIESGLARHRLGGHNILLIKLSSFRENTYSFAPGFI